MKLWLIFIFNNDSFSAGLFVLDKALLYSQDWLKIPVLSLPPLPYPAIGLHHHTLAILPFLW